MKILFVGEIVARPGRQTIKEVLPEVLKEEKVDFVIGNVENLAHGRGATGKTLKEMQEAGVQFFTGGDHLFWHKGFDQEIKDYPIVRPANYIQETAGKGYDTVNVGDKKVLIINLLGQNSPDAEETLHNPFHKVDEILKEVDKPDVILVDFHAEYSSDKEAMGFYLDGRVDIVLGTHTHVPTCDQRTLDNGTMYITDVGMTGNIDSVLGVKKNIILDRIVHSDKQVFEWETEGKRAFRGVLFDTETRDIRRIDKLLN